MTVATRVAKNSGFLILASVIGNIIMFLLTLFTARYLGTFNFGLISSALSVIGIFGVFCDLGLGYYAIQKVSRDHNLTSKYFGTAFVLRLILSILTFIAYIIFSYVGGFTGDALGVMVVIGVYMFFNSLTTFYYSLYQSNEEMHYQTIVNTVYNVGVFIIALVFIYLGQNVIWIAAAYPLAMIISFVLGSFIKFRHYPRFTVDFSRDFLKEIFVNSIPFGITSVFTSIYFWIASIILTFMSGSVAVGLFSSSQKIILVLSGLFYLISSAVFPVMSQLFVDDKEKLNDLYQKMIKYMLIISVPVAVGTSIYSTDIIKLVFGSEFLPATVCLSVLMWAVIFTFLSGTTSTLLNAINKQLLVTKVAIIGAVFSVIVNYILVSQYAYVGASITSVLTEFVVFVLMLYSLRKTEFHLNIRNIALPVIQVIISNIIMAIVLLYIKLPFITGVIVAVIVYMVALLITGSINKEDREILFGLIDDFRNRG